MTPSITASHRHTSNCDVALRDYRGNIGAIAAATDATQNLAGAAVREQSVERVASEAATCHAGVCAACGGPVVMRRRRHCDACIPGMKVAQASKAVVAARKPLAIQASAGNDPRKGPSVNQRRAIAIAEGHRRNREWKHDHCGIGRDDAWFSRAVLPVLDSFSVREIASATRLSLTACSRIRAGLRVPHPRHWPVLCALVDLDADPSAK